MKNYWLYVEPYTFIFRGENGDILYNSLDSKFLLSPGTSSVKQIIDKLSDPNSGHCVEILEEDLKDNDVSVFINQIRESFTGDIVAKSETPYPPFIFRPELRLTDNFHISLKKGTLSEDDIYQNVLKYLNEINLYLTDSCNVGCKDCTEYYKQFLFCRSQQQYPVAMPLEKCLSILDQVKYSSLGCVNFLGGDLCKYDDLSLLVSVLSSYPFKKQFYFHYKIVIPRIITTCFNTDFSITLLADADDFSSGTLLSVIKDLGDIKPDLLFVVSSESALERAIAFKEMIPEYEVDIKPLYTHSNLDFFKENIFVSDDDLRNDHPGMKGIFRRETVNEHFFGRVNILPNGDVFFNMNGLKAGNLFETDDLVNLVYQEMLKGDFWFKTRDKTSCRACYNRYLCPSPSNYELVIGKDNLCNMFEHD